MREKDSRLLLTELIYVAREKERERERERENISLLYFYIFSPFLII